MIIDCTSDLHGHYPELQGGDLLIIAGDLTAKDFEHEYFKFYQWASGQRYKKIVIIAGNHDGFLEKNGDPLTHPGVFSYLCDSGTEFEGLKIWGSPYTPTFSDWHFMRDRGEPIARHWRMIPDDTDILITHGPPFRILDETEDGENAGCIDLLNATRQIMPKLHVFGHIHEGYGQCINGGIHYVNCSHMNERYQPVNAPIRVVL